VPGSGGENLFEYKLCHVYIKSTLALSLPWANACAQPANNSTPLCWHTLSCPDLESFRSTMRAVVVAVVRPFVWAQSWEYSAALRIGAHVHFEISWVPHATGLCAHVVAPARKAYLILPGRGSHGCGLRVRITCGSGRGTLWPVISFWGSFFHCSHEQIEDHLRHIVFREYGEHAHDNLHDAASSSLDHWIASMVP
jgi:hypothetical protein